MLSLEGHQVSNEKYLNFTKIEIPFEINPRIFIDFEVMELDNLILSVYPYIKGESYNV
jgi:hypothetical protein